LARRLKHQRRELARQASAMLREGAKSVKFGRFLEVSNKKRLGFADVAPDFLIASRPCSKVTPDRRTSKFSKSIY